MATINGELTINIKYKNLNVPANMYSKAVVYHECVQQAFLKSPWHKMSKDLIKENFEVKVVEDIRIKK